MASIGGGVISKAAKKARAQRFAEEAALPPPPPPERRLAHPDFARGVVVRSDPTEKLLSMLTRRLAIRRPIDR